MVDKLTPERRSWNMSRIRSKNTKPELIVRSLLHRMGFRFRVNRKDLPGKPDIVLPKYMAVIFVHGCFWHRHTGCKGATTPSTRREFWEKKFKANTDRDKRNRRELKKAGWNVIVLWECDVKAAPGGVALKIARKLRGEVACYELPEKRKVLKASEKRLQYALAKSTDPNT
jgi:DNA mismatch endonuclease, patch repair protein